MFFFAALKLEIDPKEQCRDFKAEKKRCETVVAKELAEIKAYVSLFPSPPFPNEMFLFIFAQLKQSIIRWSDKMTLIDSKDENINYKSGLGPVDSFVNYLHLQGMFTRADEDYTCV